MKAQMRVVSEIVTDRTDSTELKKAGLICTDTCSWKENLVKSAPKSRTETKIIMSQPFSWM